MLGWVEGKESCIGAERRGTRGRRFRDGDKLICFTFQSDKVPVAASLEREMLLREEDNTVMFWPKLTQSTRSFRLHEQCHYQRCSISFGWNLHVHARCQLEGNATKIIQLLVCYESVGNLNCHLTFWCLPFSTENRASTYLRSFGTIGDSKIWSWAPRNSCPRMTALARASSNYKRQTHPLISEDVTYGIKPQVFSWKNLLVVGLKGLGAKTDWLAVNRQS
jgi:hypothetical protein